MELLYHVEITFLVYLTYAIIGWILEVTCKAIEYKKFVNRGFLIGPYCPIYGTGAILITLLLNRYIEDPFTLFIMAILICSLLEYITSYSMEKLFKARWWDYSRYRFNINGRICLETTIPFGILGLFIMYVANPFILNILLSIPSILLHTITGMLFLVFLVDNMISFKIMLGVRGTTNEFNQKVKDNTEEITRKVKEAITNKSFLNKRLIKAFPGFKSTREKIKNRREKREV